MSGGNIGDDSEMLKYFLDLRAGSDLALCSIDIKILFEDILKEDIESGFARRATSEVQACEKIAFPEIYLAEKAWDFRSSGKPKIMIARWDRSDDLHIDFSMPAMDFHDIGSEWGHPDFYSDCCGSNKE